MEVKKWNESSRLIIKDKLVWIYVTLTSFILYIYTLSPGITWGDSAKLVNYVIKGKITSDLVGGHNLHTILGLIFNLLPLQNVAYKQNLMSAFFAALALGIFYIVSEKIIKSKIAALAATMSLAVSQMFWLLAVINESYSILFFLFSLSLLFIIRYQETRNTKLIFFFWLLIGFSTSENLLLVILIPAYVLFFLLIDITIIADYKKLLSAVIGGVVGIIPTLIFATIYRHSQLSASDISILTVLKGPVRSAHIYIQSYPHSIKQLILYPTYLFYQFPFFGFMIGVLGVYNLYKSDRKIFWSTVSILLVNVLFACFYMTQRAFNLMVPGFMIFAIFIAYGVKWINEHWMFMRINIVKVVMLILIFFTPILFYDAVATYLLHHPDKMLVHVRELPYRNNIEYYLIPWKQNNYGPELYAQQIYSVLPNNAILIADFTPEDVLSYYQLAYNFRTDVRITDEDHYIFMGKEGGNALVNYIASELKNGKSVLLADDNPQYYFISDLTKTFDIQKIGLAYKVYFK